MQKHCYHYALCAALLLTTLPLKPATSKCYLFGKTTIELVTGDVTDQPDVDAIVNAANNSLIGSAGIAAVIQRKAGPRLINHLRALPLEKTGERCPTGNARVTPGFDLPNAHIIHAVGPRGSDASRASLLKSTYTEIISAINPDTGKSFTSIAIPTISIGIFGYPYEEAADIAINTLTSYAQNNAQEPRLIRLVFFKDQIGMKSLDMYTSRLSGLAK